MSGPPVGTILRHVRHLALSPGAQLRKALAGGPPAETRRRIETLPSALGGRQNLGTLRGVEVPERRGTDDAGRLLDALARGEPGAPDAGGEGGGGAPAGRPAK
ncbi:MAG TPA: hypothetical protein VFW33_23645 [Gemmataceae bacterium]|nr:hypothetical protein [Gemmataceae bacterium]